MPGQHGTEIQVNHAQLLPFLKWAGGKRWFLPFLKQHLPDKFGTYFEPFLGGGATFFFLQPQHAVLSDLNSRLIETYVAIRDDWRAVSDHLNEYQVAHTPDFYYDERSRERRGSYRRAAQFIYFNRVCWNGLYRVNLKGKFNVPLGTKTAVTLPTDDFSTVARLLSGQQLLAADFEAVIDMASKGDFVFVDPPYVTAHNFNGFAKYNEHIFSWADQERLKSAVQRAVGRGAKVLITNADHDSIRKLYKGVGQVHTVERASVIAGGSKFRQRVAELVIKTY